MKIPFRAVWDFERKEVVRKPYYWAEMEGRSTDEIIKEINDMISGASSFNDIYDLINQIINLKIEKEPGYSQLTNIARLLLNDLDKSRKRNTEKAKQEALDRARSDIKHELKMAIFHSKL